MVAANWEEVELREAETEVKEVEREVKVEACQEGEEVGMLKVVKLARYASDQNAALHFLASVQEESQERVEKEQ